MPILNVYLVPEQIRKRLYGSISPVNSFRLVLSECFGAQLPLLPDRHFFCTYATRGEVREVTDCLPGGVPDPVMLRPGEATAAAGSGIAR